MEHKKITNEKGDPRTSWFMQQHFSPEELQQLYEWEQKSGRVGKIVAKSDGGYNLFHKEDAEKSIDLVFMKEKEQAVNWANRMGYTIEE